MKMTRIILPLTTLLLCAVPAFADGESERRFLWEEANWKMAGARTRQDFLTASGVYRKLLDAGVRNGPLFYNLGTALLKAGEYDEALAALLRAERYSGSDPEIRQNILLAIAGKEKDKGVSLPWHRAPFFWHYGLSISTRITVSVCAFAAVWLALICRLFLKIPFARRLLILAFIVLVLFGSSVATTINQETDAENRGLPRFQRVQKPAAPPAGPEDARQKTDDKGQQK